MFFNLCSKGAFVTSCHTSSHFRMPAWGISASGSCETRASRIFTHFQIELLWMQSQQVTGRKAYNGSSGVCHSRSSIRQWTEHAVWERLCTVYTFNFNETDSTLVNPRQPSSCPCYFDFLSTPRPTWCWNWYVVWLPDTVLTTCNMGMRFQKWAPETTQMD